METHFKSFNNKTFETFHIISSPLFQIQRLDMSITQSPNIETIICTQGLTKTKTR